MGVIPPKLSLRVQFFYLFRFIVPEPDPPIVGASDIGQDLEYLLRVHTSYLFHVPPGTSPSTCNLLIISTQVQNTTHANYRIIN